MSQQQEDRAMERKLVISREYKVMLKPNRFTGSEHDLLEKAGAFWKDVAAAVSEVALASSGKPDTVGKRRLISFLDSKGEGFAAGGYVFRECSDLDGKSRELTLKFVHRDRNV